MYKIMIPPGWYLTSSRITLTGIGNIVSVSIFAASDDLHESGQLKSNDQILLMVPESGRFSYGTVLLMVIKVR